MEKYIKFLEFRAREIADDLTRSGETELRGKFLDLHRQDMEALRTGNLILSHRINGRIRELLRSSNKAYLSLMSRFEQVDTSSEPVGTGGAVSFARRIPYPAFTEMYPAYKDRIDPAENRPLTR